MIRNFYSLLATLLLVISVAILGHYFAPLSIFMSPALIGITVFLIFRAQFTPVVTILIIIVTIIINDIFIKLYAGGIHDFEGAGFINLFLIISSIIATILSFIFLISERKLTIIYSLGLSMLIPLLIYAYLSYFDFLGLIDSGNYSKNKAISNANKMFIKTLSFPDSVINFKNDTLHITGGWTEKQQIIDHTHLIKSYNDTSTINYIVYLRANKKFDDLDIFYKMNDTNINGSTQIDSTIKFDSHRDSRKKVLYFFKSLKKPLRDTIIKKIELN